MHKTLVRSICVTGVLPLLFSLSSCGNPSPQTRSIRYLFSPNSPQGQETLDYQIGATWDKTPVTPDMIEDGNPALRKAALATAKVTVMYATATGFIVGQKNGQVLLATNNHVIEDQDFCDETKVSFEYLGIKRMTCDKVIATNTELDLTLFTVKGADPQTTARLIAAALPISKAAPRKGQNLLTLGYGFAGNAAKKLVVDQSNDCKVFSMDGDVRYIADPDVVNPGKYKTWVFASGCDVSHGDSGSAMIDQGTGEIVGILSTGKVPKNEKIRDANHLKSVFNSNSTEVWSELTYVVPFSKVYELMGDILAD